MEEPIMFIDLWSGEQIRFGNNVVLIILGVGKSHVQVALEGTDRVSDSANKTDGNVHGRNADLLHAHLPGDPVSVAGRAREDIGGREHHDGRYPSQGGRV